jgi:outer membrane protein TolC
VIPVYGESLNQEQLIDESIKNSEKVKIQNAKFEKSVNERKSVAMNFLPKTNIDIKLLELKYAPEPEPLTMDISPLMGMLEAAINASSPGLVDLPDQVPPMEVPLELPQHQRKLGITLIQPVSQLWGIYHGYKARQIASEMQKMKRDLTKNEIEIHVTEYFLTYNMINDVLKLLNETDSQLDRYIFTTENFIEKGLTDKRGLLKIRIEKAKVAKEREKYEGLQTIIKTALSYLIEKDEKTFEIDKYSPDLVKIDKDINWIVDAQKKTRVEFKLLGKSDEIREHVDKSSYQQFIPQIAFTMGFKQDWDYTVINPEGVFFMGGVLSWGFGVDTAQAVFDYKSVKAESVI